jgi:hypothetical protein
MPQVGFEGMISAFEREKTVHALNRAAIVIGLNTIRFCDIRPSHIQLIIIIIIKTPWSESASELHRPSDRSLSAK